MSIPWSWTYNLSCSSSPQSLLLSFPSQTCNLCHSCCSHMWWHLSRVNLSSLCWNRILNRLRCFRFSLTKQSLVPSQWVHGRSRCWTLWHSDRPRNMLLWVITWLLMGQCLDHLHNLHLWCTRNGLQHLIILSEERINYPMMLNLPKGSRGSSPTW